MVQLSLGLVGYRAPRALSATEPATGPATGSLPLQPGREPLGDTLSVYIACKSPTKTCIFFSSFLLQANIIDLSLVLHTVYLCLQGNLLPLKTFVYSESPLFPQWYFASFSTAVVSHLECYPVPCTQPFPLAVASQVSSWPCSLALANPAAQQKPIYSLFFFRQL